MGLFLTVVALLTLLAGAAALVRRSRRRDAELESELVTAIREQARDRPELEVAIQPEAIAAGGAGSRLTLPRRRLLEAARKGHGAQAVAMAALDLLTNPPRPLDSSFSLKIHGPRVRALLATPVAMALRPKEPRPAQKALPDLRLLVTYCVSGRFLTEDHLRDQGIDGRDLHGIALAVQRQEFDEEVPRRVLACDAEHPRPEILRSTDGSAGAALLTLADALRPGEALIARLAGPDWLGIAPLGYSWPAGGEAAEIDSRHPAIDLVIDLVIEPAGYRIL